MSSEKNLSGEERPDSDLIARLERIEGLLRENMNRAVVKSHYSVEEFGKVVGRMPFTVRQWCNEGRIRAEKSMTQSGSSSRWVISHQEYERYNREGLLPIRRAA